MGDLRGTSENTTWGGPNLFSWGFAMAASTTGQHNAWGATFIPSP